MLIDYSNWLMINYELQIQQSIELFDKLYSLLDKTRIPRLNEELVKLVPTQNSKVFMSTDMIYEPASIGFTVLVSNPASNVSVETIDFTEVFKMWAKKNIKKRVQNVNICLTELTMAVSDKWDIDFVEVYYDESSTYYALHFRIFDRIGYEREKKRA